MQAIIGTDIATASQALHKGELVAIPTETVYGLAANALDATAVIKIFEAKKRPSFDPLIVHIGTKEAIHNYVTEVPAIALKLMNAFWPGPLTLLLPKKSNIPDIVTSGLDTVGIRMPNHTLTLDLLNTINFPLAAPSANPFGYISPTTAQHVVDQLGNEISYVLDGGACTIGVESTIVGFENNIPTVYRLGGISIEQLENVIGKVELALNQSSNPKAPGQLKSHYAPRKPFYLGDVRMLLEKHKASKVGVISVDNEYTANNVIINKVIAPHKDLQLAAQQLFAVMRELDNNTEIEYIIAEIFPDYGLGRAINDRLQRAATI